ncbi:hypothetical protein RDI58_023903 [Solanum bulbocastanum]|uniref:Uncharacterized protein n=1 Tax=Solanum bulbocastanum TaxID=147425 RepID=A0AAN8T4T2_SOLBU
MAISYNTNSFLFILVFYSLNLSIIP